jgi:hypothetical protein
MKFETIQNSGKLGIEYLTEDGDGIKVSRDFLNNLIRNIIKRSTKYFDETGDHIFIYREKQIHSVVCPSIVDLTPCCVMEHPLTRKPHGDEEYSGKCDYWISYRNYSFVMELKHCYFAYRNANAPRQEISNKFNKCIQQLKSIKKEECRNLSINKGMIRIALQTLVFYRGSQNELSYDDLEEQDFEDDFEQLIQNSDLEKSNVRSLWLLNKRLVKSFKYDNGNEIYPAVAFIGKIHEVIT